MNTPERTNPTPPRHRAPAHALGAPAIPVARGRAASGFAGEGDLLTAQARGDDAAAGLCDEHGALRGQLTYGETSGNSRDENVVSTKAGNTCSSLDGGGSGHAPDTRRGFRPPPPRPVSASPRQRRQRNNGIKVSPQRPGDPEASVLRTRSHRGRLPAGSPSAKPWQNSAGDTRVPLASTRPGTRT